MLPESPENIDEKNRPLLMIPSLYGLISSAHFPYYC